MTRPAFTFQEDTLLRVTLLTGGYEDLSGGTLLPPHCLHVSRQGYTLLLWQHTLQMSSHGNRLSLWLRAVWYTPIVDLLIQFLSLQTPDHTMTLNH